MEQARPKYMQLRNPNIFKGKVLKFIRPSGNSVFRCHNPKGVKLLTRLRLGLSHFWGHKFKLGFLDSLNPGCSCCQDIERQLISFSTVLIIPMKD